jgi:hypothetical protein
MVRSTTRMYRATVSEYNDVRDHLTCSSAVSLHAHTRYSRESLAEVPTYIARVPVLGPRFMRELSACLEGEGCALDYSGVSWHPPVGPRDVFESEAGQIEQRFDMDAIVSLTDHDDITAGIELQSFYAGTRAPISFEWTVPFDGTYFHLGLHNLPPAAAGAWFERCAAVTQAPTTAAITATLSDFDALDGTLIVLNHPLWDLAGAGAGEHARAIRRLLDLAGGWLHGLELNGYRSWTENARVRQLAEAVGMPVISGGDRHGTDANALVNVTSASTFAEFAAELHAGVSHVVVMPEYRQYLPARVLASAAAVFRRRGSRRLGPQQWTDRVSWTIDGNVRTLSHRWPNGGPVWVRSAVTAFGMLTSPVMLPVTGAALGLAGGMLGRASADVPGLETQGPVLGVMATPEPVPSSSRSLP